jgi:hypothetical protein
MRYEFATLRESMIRKVIYGLAATGATMLFLIAILLGAIYFFFRGMISLATILASAYWWQLIGKVPRFLEPRER